MPPRFFPVRDLMVKDFGVIGTEDFASKAIGMIRGGKYHVLVVMDEDKRFVGMLTERMIARSRLNPNTTKVRSIAKPSPKASPEVDLSEAALLMLENDLRYLPIFEDGDLVGVVSYDSVLSKLAQSELGLVRIKDLMTANPTSVDASASIAKTLALMRNKGISKLPVVRNGKLVGIITMHDIVEKAIYPRDRQGFGEFVGETIRSLSNSVRSVMTKRVLSVEKNTSFRTAVGMMIEHEISSLVVVEDHRAIGIVTEKDLLEPVARLGMDLKEKMAVQTAFKSAFGDEEKTTARNLLESFASKHRRVLGGGTLGATFKYHKEKRGESPLVHCRIRLNSGKRQFLGFGEERGLDTALRMALSSVERQVMRSKELRRARRYSRRTGD